MDLPWLDLPFTFLTLLLATRLAYDYYGLIAATFAGSFSLQIFLFYCFARWYRHTISARTSGQQPRQESTTDSPPILTPLLEPDFRSSWTNRCFAVVFMVFVPLIIVVFERSQADIIAYVLCFLNIIVMVVWLSPDSTSTVSAAKSFLGLGDDEEDSSGCSNSEDKCCVCLGVMKEEQALRELPRCKHWFHEDCIGKWLKSHPTCPVCRSTVVPPSDDNELLNEALRLV